MLRELLNEQTRDLSTTIYWIAESAYTHEGEIAYLHDMIEQLGEVRPNAMKFHIMLDLDEYIVSEHSLYPELKKWLFGRDEWKDVFRRCREKGMEIIGLCDELTSLEFLIEEQVDAIAVHATCINDYFMLKRLAEVEQPVFIGIGGIALSEIDYALQMLAGKSNVVMMYGIQHYPTRPESIHLSKLPLYCSKFHCQVGYADHTANSENMNRLLMYAAAYGLGARIFEQHITLDLSEKREEDESAIEVKEFVHLREQLGVVSAATGSTQIQLTDAERNYFSTIRKCMVAETDLQLGVTLTEKHIKFKRVELQGDLEQHDFSELVGKPLCMPVRQGEAFSWKHISMEKLE